MKTLFITRLYYPHVGGVEKHVSEVTKSLKRKGHVVSILTEKYNNKLKDKETVDGVNVVRFSYPHFRFIGLIFIWWQIFKNRKYIQKADVIHIHDVFIWYLPFNLLYPKKPVFTTIHGLEWNNPLSKISIWQKRLAVNFSTRAIGVGKFLEKYLDTQFDLIIYGATTMIRINRVKKANNIVYVGRLEVNTGLLEYIKWLNVNGKGLLKIEFCGDGNLRSECEKYGVVYGFTDPTPYYKKAEYCVPGGYLAALEALSYNCKLKLFWNNKVKEDYWKMSPFYKLKGEELREWARKQTWDKLADEYIDLYNRSK